jgi:hypothetical protein
MTYSYQARLHYSQCVLAQAFSRCRMWIVPLPVLIKTTCVVPRDGSQEDVGHIPHHKRLQPTNKHRISLLTLHRELLPAEMSLQSSCMRLKGNCPCFPHKKSRVSARLGSIREILILVSIAVKSLLISWKKEHNIDVTTNNSSGRCGYTCLST